MKTLILILLAAVCAQAQTVADLARQERARQARLQSARAVTTESIRSTTTTSAPAPAAAPDAPAPAAPAAPPVAPQPAAVRPTAPAPAPDPVRKWNEDMQKLRTQLRQLQGDETSLQLQLNDLTNQFTAPVSDENTRRQIQTRLGETQSRLNTVRSELDQTRKSVQAMEAQGPPTPGR